MLGSLECVWTLLAVSMSCCPMGMWLGMGGSVEKSGILVWKCYPENISEGLLVLFSPLAPSEMPHQPKCCECLANIVSRTSMGALLLLFTHLVVSTLCDPMDYSTPALPVPHLFLKFAQVHVHCISDAIQPSHPLMPSSPSAPNPSQHQGLFQWVICSHQMTGVSASASVLPTSIQCWFPLGLTGLISLLSMGS